MADYHGVHGPDDLTIPFCFVPHGAPEPRAWLARHPDHIRLPATFVPHAPETPNPPSRPDPSPPIPSAALAASATDAARPAGEAPALATAEIGEFLAGLSPMFAAVGLFSPIQTASGTTGQSISSDLVTASAPIPEFLCCRFKHRWVPVRQSSLRTLR